MKITYRHWIRFAIRAVHSGEIPLWNPFIFCGQPFMPSTHATLFYPPNWLYLFALPQPLSINLCILTQVVLMASFTVYYCRVRGTSNASASIAGVIAGLGSVMTCRIFAGHFTMLCTVPWIPLMFALQEKLFAGYSRTLLPFALAGAAMFMGGHLQYAYYYGLFLAASILLYAISNVPRGNRARWILKQSYWHAVAGFIAISLVAVEALPAIDIAQHSLRSGSTNLEWLRQFAMPPENLLGIIAPGFWGRGVDYWGRWEWWEATFYMGIPGLVLCITAITVQVSSRKISHIALLFPLLIVISIAGFLPILPAILRWIPGWIMFRGHNRVLSFALVFGAVLAAHGFDLVRNSDAARRICRRLFVFIAATAILLSCFASSQGFWSSIFSASWFRRELFNPDPAESANAMQHVVNVARFSCLCGALWALCGFALVWKRDLLSKRFFYTIFAALTVIDLTCFAAPAFSFVESEHNIIPPAVAAFFSSQRSSARSGIPQMLNEGTSYEVPSIEGDDIVGTRYYNTFACAYLNLPKTKPNFTLFLQGESQLLDAANLKYVAIPPGSAAAQSGMYRPVNNLDGLIIGERTTALPRAYVVGDAKWMDEAASEDDILQALKDPHFNFHESVLLVGNQRDQQPSPKPFAAVAASVTYTGLHKAEIVAPRGGWLVLTDGFYPWWHAYIRDRQVKIYRANSAFRAVKVLPGDLVTFRYENPLVPLGAAISLVTFAALLAFQVIEMKRRRSRNVA
jgi:hypothetical protein